MKKDEENKSIKLKLKSNDKKDNSNLSSSTDILINSNQIKIEKSENKAFSSSGKPTTTVIQMPVIRNTRSKVISKGFTHKIAGKIKSDNKKHISKYEVSKDFHEELLLYYVNIV